MVRIACSLWFLVTMNLKFTETVTISVTKLTWWELCVSGSILQRFYNIGSAARTLFE